MAKNKVSYVCSNCHYETTGYFGKCPSCGSWGTLEEKTLDSDKVNTTKIINNSTISKKLSEVDTNNTSRILSDIGELNRVLGNGIVRDSVTIVTAKPGAGKSTLLLQLSNDLAKKGYKVLYASGEESESQIKNRSNRINVDAENIWIMSTNSINDIENEVEKIDPDILIFDSIQTIVADDLPQKSGSPTQINEVSSRIVRLSKYSNKKRASFIVGQMTKADELAGVRTLEHLVDAVLILEATSLDQIRTLYSSKNRYGDTGELGFFEMTEAGLISIDNPSEFFVSKDDDGFGKALTVIRQGSRFIVGEIEALVSKSFFPYPQRISDATRKDSLNILASIIDETTKLSLEDKNIILKATGGIKLDDTSADFAMAMSIISSYLKKPLNNDLAFCGELGLTGKIKKVQNIKGRINELSRLGYKKVAVSQEQKIENKKSNIEIIYIKNISEAIEIFF